jgi:tripartite-type tricarboxylate transporter receptor subunit TctC
MMRKFALALVGLLAPMFSGALPAAAQDYPSRTIRLIVPYPPGGSADLIGRMLADQLTERMRQTVIVENRGGASGAIGSEAVARAKPDGYTVLIGIADTHAIGPAVNKNLPYHPINDFEPISLLATQPLALAVGPAVKADSLDSFVKAAQAARDSMSYASNGVGGIQHMAMESIASMAKFQPLHVPFPGSGPAMADVIGGHVDAIFISLQGGDALFKAGSLRALAIGAPKRLEAAPSVPTFAESGYPDFMAQQWYGLFAPKGMQTEIVDILNKQVAVSMKDPKIADKLGAAGTTAIGSASAEFATFLKDQVVMWDKVATENNITVK